MSAHYILEGRQAVPVDMLTWDRWFQADDESRRRVARTDVAGADVSTVFIGVDHRFSGEGPPLIFETMVFGGPLDGEMDRYSTWEEAEAGHAAMVERVKQAVPFGEPAMTIEETVKRIGEGATITAISLTPLEPGDTKTQSLVIRLDNGGKLDFVVTAGGAADANGNFVQW